MSVVPLLFHFQFCWFYSSLFFMLSLAKGFSILFIFSKNKLLVLLIFIIVSFISFSFIAALIFMISFLLLILGFLSSFSSCFRCKTLPFLKAICKLMSFFFCLFHYSAGSLQLPDQRLNPCPLQWKPSVLNTELPGNSPGSGC